ncbi:hypothetical protein IT568_08035 [bacterium]|nr:hypothetical protein [bacterium]
MKSLLKILFLAVCLLACSNPFDTRKAQNPEGIGNNFRNLSDEEDVLHNLVNAFKQQKPTFYLQLFDSTFIFKPSKTTDFSFENWSFDSENNFVNRFFSDAGNQNSNIKIDTANVEYQKFSSQNALVKFEYKITFDYSYSSEEEPASSFLGYSEFTLELKNDKWKIVQWKDATTNSNEKTWTSLKALVLNSKALK